MIIYNYFYYTYYYSERHHSSGVAMWQLDP